MSARQDIAQRIADFICKNEMTTPYGGDVIKSSNHYTVLFSKAAVLDGSVDVYGSKFIRVIFVTQYRDMPYRGTFIFEREEDAIDFLDKAFVNRDFDAAMKIPTRNK